MGLLQDFVQTNAQVKAWDRANDAIQKETEHELAVQRGEAEPNEFEEIKDIKDSFRTGGVDGKVEFDKPQKKPADLQGKIYIVIAVVLVAFLAVYLLLR